MHRFIRWKASLSLLHLYCDLTKSRSCQQRQCSKCAHKCFHPFEHSARRTTPSLSLSSSFLLYRVPVAIYNLLVESTLSAFFPLSFPFSLSRRSRSLKLSWRSVFTTAHSRDGPFYSAAVTPSMYNGVDYWRDRWRLRILFSWSYIICFFCIINELFRYWCSYLMFVYKFKSTEKLLSEKDSNAFEASVNKEALYAIININNWWNFSTGGDQQFRDCKWKIRYCRLSINARKDRLVCYSESRRCESGAHWKILLERASSSQAKSTALLSHR